jgi:hypothetical protein
MLISTVLTQHLAPAVAGTSGTAAVLFAVVDGATTETIGIGSVVALMVGVMGLVFRTQQQQIRSQRYDMDHMAKRILHLEAELDARRRGGFRRLALRFWSGPASRPVAWCDGPRSPPTGGRCA